MHTLDLNPTALADPIIDGLNATLPQLPMVMLFFLFGALVIRVITRLLRFIFTVTIVHIALRDVLVSVIEIILWILLAARILGLLGFQNVIVFFTGSIAAIGLAMAAGGSTLVSDIIAGIFLARDRDFDIGDEVIAGETPTRGIIESMDARRTRIRDQDGVLHIIPNSVIERKEWVLVDKSQDASPFVRAVKTANQTARKLKAAATETKVVVEKQTLVTKKKLALRKNAQSQAKVAPDTMQE